MEPPNWETCSSADAADFVERIKNAIDSNELVLPWPRGPPQVLAPPGFVAAPSASSSAAPSGSVAASSSSRSAAPSVPKKRKTAEEEMLEEMEAA